MKGADYDNYVMRFESLARKANYATGNEETYDMFLQGLPETLLQDTLKPPIPLNYNEAKERVKLLAQGRAVIEGILKKIFSEGTPFQCLNNQPRWPFFQNSWEGSNQRSCPQNYNSTNVPHLWTMSQYQWTSAEVMPPTTGEEGEMETGDKEEEDHLPEEMYPYQDMEIPQHASCNWPGLMIQPIVPL